MNGIANPEFLKLVDLAGQLTEAAPHELPDISRQIEATLARYVPPISAEEKLMAEQVGVSLSELSHSKARAAAAARADASLSDGERQIVADTGVSPAEFVALRDARAAATRALAGLPEEQVNTLRADCGGDVVKMHAEARACGWVTR